jgi:hypothetical protein
VAVVPADERDGGQAVGQVLARDAHAPVGLGADRPDDLVVERLDVAAVDVPPEGHVAEVAHPLVGQDPLEDARDRLDRLVVGRDAVAQQPERRREAVEDVDGHLQIPLQQRLRRVEAGRTGADDRDPQGAGRGAELLHDALRETEWAVDHLCLSHPTVGWQPTAGA